MDSTVFLVLEIVVAVNIVVISSMTLLGPADITVERVEQCENPELYPIETNIVMKKLNRTHAGFTACFNIPADLGPTSTFKMTAAKWGDGGWKPNALNHVQQDICETVNTHVKGPWTEALKASGRENNGCPIVKGDYCVKDLVMSLDGLFSSMLYGKFRADGIFLLENQPLICVRAYITSTPVKYY